MKVAVHSVLALVAWLGAPAPAQAGHEFPFYPSFYPQEIQIETVDPAFAAEQLQKGSLHAYVGSDLFEGKTAPASVSHVESLGAYVVVTFNTASGLFTDRRNRCAAAREAVESLAAGKDTYVFHPYPVTPYHSDYLHHFDVAESAKQEHRKRSAGSATGQPLRIRARGKLAEKLVQPGRRSDGKTWDASVEAIEVNELIASRSISANGWVGPPWIKEGWFHAYLLHAGTLADSASKQAADATLRRLVTGTYGSLPERLNLERKLVALLRAGCERVVAGYTVKREYFNADYSGGVENVAHDSHTGLNSPIFLRTVKLKDFPWNGWLKLGIETKPSAAWNPVGGFDDPAGRLIWSAVGDPALFPTPHSGSWVPNRVTPVPGTTGSISQEVEVPQDAVLPEPGTGLPRNVGHGRRAAARILYRVLTSAFHDGTRMTVGDLLSPFFFSYRWGAKGAQREADYDPVVDASTALLRERLAGLRVLRVERDVLAFGDMKLTYEVPVIEAYVNYRSPDPLQVASVAPPWSSLPWHLIALMEEAVKRGFGAFSREEAKRRSVPWLDLAREQKIKDALAPLVDDFARQGYVPDSLKGFVTAGEARERWTALKEFYAKHRHFLVTNGPYRLDQWSENSVVLQVFRDLTFPRGVGSFDNYSIPLGARVSRTELRGDRLEVHAEVERVERFGREYRIVTEPFRKKISEGDKRSLPLCRYVVVSPDGTIAATGTSEAMDPGIFRVDLKGHQRPGPHTIMVALSLDGNHVNQQVKVIPWTP